MQEVKGRLGVRGQRLRLGVLGCALILAVLGSGCNRVANQDARERNNRLVSRAYTLLDAGEYAEAGRLLREALDVYPTMARPHLDLALILHDQQGDFVRAIYHYQRYLELRPGTEKDGMIEQRIEQAREALIRSYGGVVAISGLPEEVADIPAAAAPSVGTDVRVAGSGSVADTGREAAGDESRSIAQMREERDGLRIAMAEQERLLQTRQDQIIKLQGRIRVLERQVDTATGTAAASRASESRPPEAPIAGTPAVVTPDPAAPRTYVVRANDSLSVIAHRVYGDATKWRVIQDANREVLGNSEMLRIGQVLVIPDL